MIIFRDGLQQFTFQVDKCGALHCHGCGRKTDWNKKKTFQIIQADNIIAAVCVKCRMVHVLCQDDKTTKPVKAKL